MYTVQAKKCETKLVIAPAKPRNRFVGLARNGGGFHQTRRNDRTKVKLQLRRGDY